VAVFYIVFLLIIAQRLIELRIANRNRKWMLAQRGTEIGAGHYPLIVLLHAGFFASLWIEVFSKGFPLFWAWPFIVCLLVSVQVIRYWAITSLGPYWNTRIIFVPGADAVRKGPYRYMRHPNYSVVILELLLIPLLFNAYITLLLFGFLNALMLRHRIRVEEEGLINHTNYGKTMESRFRFIPAKPEEKT
jgi:methyltransferase